MTIRPAALVALGIAAYLAFLVATLPASFVAARLPVPGLHMDEVRGTIWNGEARVTLKSDGGTLEVDRLAWHLVPARLLAGRLAWRLQAKSPAVSGHAQVERGITAVELRDVDAIGDAAALAPLVPLAAAWRPEGAVHAAASRIAWDGRDVRGEARLEWKRAGIALSTVHPLGSYRIDASAAGGPARFQVSTEEGPLRIAGRGTFDAPGNFTFSGDARADPAAAAALQPLLDLLGPRRADGARSLDWHMAALGPSPRS